MHFIHRFHSISFAFILFSIGIAGVASGGCATTIAAIHLMGGELPTSMAGEDREWLDGEPNRVLTVEARLTTPPRVLCHSQIHEPTTRVTQYWNGLDTGGRIAIGFIGVSEIASGLMPLLLQPDEGIDPGWAAVATYVAIDGLATIILAALLDPPAHQTVSVIARQDYVSDVCPPGLAFVLGQESFPIGPDGYMSPADGTYVMGQVVETGLAVGLRNGDDVRMTDVPPDVRCAWALHLNHPAERALCPQAPVIVQPPPPPPPRRPPPIIVPVPVPVPR